MKNKCIQLTTLSPPGTVDFNRVNAQCRKCFPIVPEVRVQIEKTVLDAYYEALAKEEASDSGKEKDALQV